jgi:hypothetical protein
MILALAPRMPVLMRLTTTAAIAKLVAVVAAPTLAVKVNPTAEVDPILGVNVVTPDPTTVTNNRAPDRDLITVMKGLPQAVVLPADHSILVVVLEAISLVPTALERTTDPMSVVMDRVRTKAELIAKLAHMSAVHRDRAHTTVETIKGLMSAVMGRVHTKVGKVVELVPIRVVMEAEPARIKAGKVVTQALTEAAMEVVPVGQLTKDHMSVETGRVHTKVGKAVELVPIRLVMEAEPARIKAEKVVKQALTEAATEVVPVNQLTKGRMSVEKDRGPTDLVTTQSPMSVEKDLNPTDQKRMKARMLAAGIRISLAKMKALMLAARALVLIVQARTKARM